MSFKTIAGRSDGIFFWFPALSDDQEKICRIHQNYLVALREQDDSALTTKRVKRPMAFKGYCKRGNIRGALIFANFAQNSASANSKAHENICNILYAHFGHVGVVYWPCVLMQMGNILENVWGLFVFVLPSCLYFKCIIVWCCAVQKWQVRIIC